MLIRIPANAPVGSWSVTVATWYGEKSMNESKYDMEMFNATASDPFYVLFNPFNESFLIFVHAGDYGPFFYVIAFCNKNLS